MTAIVTCVACQYGQHDQHQEVVEALSPEQIDAGMCGGKVCRCQGECVEAASQTFSEWLMGARGLGR